MKIFSYKGPSSLIMTCRKKISFCLCQTYRILMAKKIRRKIIHNSPSLCYSKLSAIIRIIVHYSGIIFFPPFSQMLNILPRHFVLYSGSFQHEKLSFLSAICIEVKLNVKVLFIYLFSCGLISEVLQSKSNSVQFDSSLQLLLGR